MMDEIARWAGKVRSEIENVGSHENGINTFGQLEKARGWRGGQIWCKTSIAGVMHAF
jgi:hypothetical protein